MTPKNRFQSGPGLQRAHPIVTKYKDPSSELQTATVDGMNDSPNFDFLRQTTTTHYNSGIILRKQVFYCMLHSKMYGVNRWTQPPKKPSAAIMVHSSQLSLLYCWNLENNCSLERLWKHLWMSSNTVKYHECSFDNGAKMKHRWTQQIHSTRNVPEGFLQSWFTLWHAMNIMREWTQHYCYNSVGEFLHSGAI